MDELDDVLLLEATMSFEFMEEFPAFEQLVDEENVRVILVDFVHFKHCGVAKFPENRDFLDKRCSIYVRLLE